MIASRYFSCGQLSTSTKETIGIWERSSIRLD
jgi:hypothetical protein